MALVSVEELTGAPAEDTPEKKPARAPLVSAAELMGTAEDTPEEPGFFSKAVDAVKSVGSTVASAFEGAAAGAPTRAAFKPSGPAIAPGTVPSLATPKPAPGIATPKALGAAQDESVAFPGQPKEPSGPIPIKIGPGSPVMQAAADEARQAPIAEQFQLPQAKAAAAGPTVSLSDLVAPQPEKPKGMIPRAIEAVGLAPSEETRAKNLFFSESVLSPDQPTTEFGKAMRTVRKAVNALPENMVNRILLGFPNQILDAYGFSSPKARAPETTAEEITGGAGDLLGFIAGPAKVAHALTAGNIGKLLLPAATNGFTAALAKQTASQAATLAVASGIAHLGEAGAEENLWDAYHVMGEHVKGGAILGAAFGAVGGAIPGNALLPRAARLAVGLTAIDAAMGTQPLDDRALAQKVFDYGLNVFFLYNGQNPRGINALLEKEAAARGKGVRPEDVLKSALDKAMERSAQAPSSEVKTEAGKQADLVRNLRAVFAEEVGDVATQTTATELRQARDLAEEKTGGAIRQTKKDQPAGPEAGPALLDPFGRPLSGGVRGAAQAKAAEPIEPAVVMTLGGPLETAADVAGRRVLQNVGIPEQKPTNRVAPVEFQGLQETGKGKPPLELWGLTEDLPGTPHVKGSTVGRATLEEMGFTVPPVPAGAKPGERPREARAPKVPAASGRPETFRTFIEASGKRWPLTARDPDYARLRTEFDEFRKGLYESRRGEGGMWAVVNRMTGEEVDHLPGGAKAQLEANRLNAVVTMDQWRAASVPGAQPMIRMELKPKEDLSAKAAPEPKLEAGTPAAVEAQKESARVEGPPASQEAPAPAAVPAPPPVVAAAGKEQEIRVPAGNRYKVRYEVVDAGDLIPSHNAKTFAKDARYPEGVQNRPYHSDKSEQVKVIKQSQDFDPGFLLIQRPTSQGSPILAGDSNVVLSGNSRSMTLMRLAGTPGFDPYRTQLREQAGQFGIKPEDVDRVQNPVLVRRLVGTDTTPEFYRRFAKETNETFTQALNTQAQAVSQGAALKPETMEWIAGEVDALGEAGTLREFLRAGRDRELVRRLVSDGVFTERELSRFIDPRTTQINEDGKRLVERAILGAAIPDPDLLGQAPSSVVSKVERALGAIAKIKGRGAEWDLGKDLEDAVRTVIEVKAREAKSVGDIRRQGSMLEEAGPSRRADTLADALLAMKPNDFKAAIGRYADEAQRDVRGQGALEFATPKTPEVAFREAFGEGPESGPRFTRAAEKSAPYDAETNLREVGTLPAELEPKRRTPYDTPEIIRLREEQAAVPETIGTNTPEREALRQRLADEVYGQGATRKERRLSIVMGPPAAGKSTVLVNPLAERDGALVIDSDAVKLLIPESARGRYNAAVHKESAEIAGEAYARALAAGDNIVLPVVGKGMDTLEGYIRDARNANYKVHLALMDIPAEKSAERTARRIMEGLDRGESSVQFVDPQYALEIGERPKINYGRLVAEGRIDSHEAFSNDVPFGDPPSRLGGSAEAGGDSALRGPGRLPADRVVAPDQGVRGGAEEEGRRSPAGSGEVRAPVTEYRLDSPADRVVPAEPVGEAPPPDYDLPPVSAAEVGGRGLLRSLTEAFGRVVGSVAEPKAGYGDRILDAPFTSALERAVTDKMPERATPDQVRAIAKSPGIKADEVKWTGLEDWLAEQKGPVTKAQVQAFLRDNAVKIEETIKRDDALSSREDDSIALMRERLEGMRSEYDALAERANRTQRQADRMEALHQSIDDVYRDIEDAESALPGSTKFSKYTLPGGQNYREILLMLPAKGGNTNEALAQKWFKKPYAELAPGERDFVIREAKTEPPVGEYRSSHWDEPNVLASIRFNDRVDKDGKKILFLEELQSDWHQEGRRKGYINPKYSREREVGLRTQIGVLDRRLDSQARRDPDMQRERDTLQADLDAMKGGTVPAAPFAKTWHELAFKRMLRWAAEHGYDRVAWTTGAQQAERYDLSKHIGHIKWDKLPDGDYAIRATGLRGGEIEGLRNRRTAPDELADVIDKELADKILASSEKAGTFEGLDLKVGGEGMKGFYDKILPEFAAKYGKKWGATVGETTLKTDNAPAEVVARYADQPDHPFTKRQTAIVHSVDVTPEMRRSVLIEGQNLFSPESPYAASKARARKGATTADRETAQLALFDLEQTAKQPVESVVEKPAKPKRPPLRGEEAGAGVRTVSRMVDEFKDKGFIDFRGQTVRDGAEGLRDLAIIGQIARDPRYETFRYFYTKGNEIVGSEAFSSRLPGTASIIEGVQRVGMKTMAEADVEIAKRRAAQVKSFAAMRNRMNRLGADGYYIMHNHPSGRPEASREDLAVTELIAGKVPGFKGHVVINSGEFGAIFLSDAGHAVATVGRLDAKAPTAPKAEDPLLRRVGGQKIMSAEDLAQIGRNLKVPDNYVSLIHRDSSGSVRAVQEMPVALFSRAKEAQDFIRGQQRAFGATSTFAVFKPTIVTLEQGRQFVKDGVLTDAIAPGATAAESALNTLHGRGDIPLSSTPKDPERDLKTIRVQEDTEPYRAAKPLEVAVKKNLLEYGREVYGGGVKDFKTWADKMASDIGPGVRPYLPDGWAELLREMARTQGKKAVATIEADRRAGDGAPPKPPKSARRAEGSEPPLEPPPLLEDILSQSGHQATVKAAEDLFLKTGVKREKGTLISDQILDMLRDGRLSVDAMAAVLGKHGMTFTEFGENLFRPGVRDAARRLGALGLLAQKLKAANLPAEVLGDIRQREPELDEAIRSLSWWKRANNVRRGLLVTQLATAIRNFESQIGRVGLDVLDQGLQGTLQRRFGKGQTVSATDGMGTLLDVFSQLKPSGHKAMREKVDAILEAFPKEGARLFDSYMSDVTKAANRDGAVGKIDAAFDRADAAVDVLNTVNRFQEYVVRRAVFAGKLEQVLRAKGKDLDAIVRDNQIGAIDKADIAEAAKKALEVTYAESPAYGSTGYHIMKVLNGTPLSLPFPFPRFMMNSIKFLYEFSPMGVLGFLSPAERQRFANGDTRLISRATIGTAMFLAAWAMREYAGGEKWYEVQLPGMERAIDARPFNPFAAYLFMADVAKRTKDGTLYKLSAADIAKGVLSVNVRAGLGSYTLDQFVEGLAGLSTPEDLKKFAAGMGGRFVAGLMTPLQTFTDFYAQIAGEEAQKLRDTKSEPFLGPIKQRIPGLGEGLPEAAKPTGADTPRRESPGIRQLTGLTLTSAKNDLEKELDRLQFDRREIQTFTGDSTIDTLVAEKMGLIAEQYVGRVATPKYDAAGDAEKALMLRDWFTEIRRKALAQAKREAPDLFREQAEKRRPMRERMAIEETLESTGRLPAGVRR